MSSTTKIPGLKQILEEQTDDGRIRFVFDIDDDRSDEFFRQFGLEPGDEEGFERMVIEAINNFARGGRE
jgi:hypothetical protein